MQVVVYPVKATDDGLESGSSTIGRVSPIHNMNSLSPMSNSFVSGLNSFQLLIEQGFFNLPRIRISGLERKTVLIFLYSPLSLFVAT